MNETAAGKMAAARADMLTACPFWGALALRLVLVEDPTCATGWTDGVSLGYNPEYVNALSHDERVFLIAHEVAHCAFGHPWRRDGRDHFQFNVATDLAINSELARHGFKLPTSQTHSEFIAGGRGVLLDAEYEGRGAEWIYDRTADAAPESDDEDEGGATAEREGGDHGEAEEGDERDTPNNAPPGSDEDGEDEDEDEGGGEAEEGDERDEGDTGSAELPGEVRDAPESTGEGGHDMGESEWRQATIEAAMMASVRGDTGGHIDRFVDLATRPRLDWVAVLQRFTCELAQADYTWRRPNARYAPLGIYLPALAADGLGPVVIAIDTSGSVDDVQLSRIEAEARAVVAEAHPIRTTVAYCDTRVNAVETFERGDPVTLTPKGGGGTDFRPVFDYVAGMDEPPACLIYFTDLYGVFPAVAPDYPVLWVNTGRYDFAHASVPFGEVVRAG